MRALGVQLPLIVHGDILHNILLGILKHLITWVEQFLGKHQCLEAFDRIWESILPYPEYQPPQKRYRQITMWSSTEMREVNWVILACFMAALRDPIPNTPGLAAGAHADVRSAICCMLYLTNFCLIAQYCSHTPQTIGYMD